MAAAFVYIAAFVALCASGADALRPFGKKNVFSASHEAARIADSPYNWTEGYYEHMPVDHFAFADSRTFRLRYFVNVDSYRAGGAIFFYTGNEGKLESFTVNTGFMWDNAPKYNAALVFVEHRYYGKSLPFGNKSFDDVKNLGYLSSEQALADFAVTIPFFKNKLIPHASNAPVIAFGGSYGGMLTAWMRIKYPHLIDGALAGSAPLLWFRGGGVAEDAYDHIVSRTFKLSGCSLRTLTAAFDALRQVTKTQEGVDYVNSALKLTGNSKVRDADDSEYILQTIDGIMGNVVMLDYPYEANFMQKLPAWPVKAMCKAFPSKLRDKRKLVGALHNILDVWYNSTGELRAFCLRGADCPDDDQLGAMDGWNWQVCTEIGFPSDVFTRTCPFSLSTYRDGCVRLYERIGYDGALLRPDWALTNYGRNFSTATNIVFSNGWLDPWSAGGWRLAPTTEGSLVSLIVEEGAHHYDLRASHPNDTSYVKEVRRLELLNIDRWLREAHARTAAAAPAAAASSYAHPNHHHRHHSHAHSFQF